MNTIDRVPEDILGLVFSFTYFHESCRISRVSKRFNDTKNTRNTSVFRISLLTRKNNRSEFHKNDSLLWCQSDKSFQFCEACYPEEKGLARSVLEQPSMRFEIKVGGWDVNPPDVVHMDEDHIFWVFARRARVIKVNFDPSSYFETSQFFWRTFVAKLFQSISNDCRLKLDGRVLEELSCVDEIDEFGSPITLTSFRSLTRDNWSAKYVEHGFLEGIFLADEEERSNLDDISKSPEFLKQFFPNLESLCFYVTFNPRREGFMDVITWIGRVAARLEDRISVVIVLDLGKQFTDTRSRLHQYQDTEKLWKYVQPGPWHWDMELLEECLTLIFEVCQRTEVTVTSWQPIPVSIRDKFTQVGFAYLKQEKICWDDVSFPDVFPDEVLTEHLVPFFSHTECSKWQAVSKQFQFVCERQRRLGFEHELTLCWMANDSLKIRVLLRAKRICARIRTCEDVDLVEKFYKNYKPGSSVVIRVDDKFDREDVNSFHGRDVDALRAMCRLAYKYGNNLKFRSVSSRTLTDVAACLSDTVRREGTTRICAVVDIRSWNANVRNDLHLANVEMSWNFRTWRYITDSGFNVFENCDTLRELNYDSYSLTRQRCRNAQHSERFFGLAPKMPNLRQMGYIPVCCLNNLPDLSTSMMLEHVGIITAREDSNWDGFSENATGGHLYKMGNATNFDFVFSMECSAMNLDWITKEFEFFDRRIYRIRVDALWDELWKLFVEGFLLGWVRRLRAVVGDDCEIVFNVCYVDKHRMDAFTRKSRSRVDGEEVNWRACSLALNSELRDVCWIWMSRKATVFDKAAYPHTGKF